MGLSPLETNSRYMLFSLAMTNFILCGVRGVRDYLIHQEGGEIITGGSAFNIKAKSLRMGNFSQEEVRALCLQHTQVDRPGV